MYRELIRKFYREAVALKNCDLALKNALNTSERIPAFIDNLSIEFQKVQMKRIKPIEEKHIREIVYDFTDLFIAGLETEAKLRYESDAQKAVRLAEQAKKENPDQALKEMGVKIEWKKK